MDLIDRLSQAVALKKAETLAYTSLCSAIFGRADSVEDLWLQYQDACKASDEALTDLVKERES